MLALFGIGPLATSAVPPAGRGSGLSLVEAFPNPARGPVTFRLSVPAPGPVRLNIYDTAGRLRRAAWNQPLSAGSHIVTGDARDSRNAPLPAGVYYYELQSGENRVTRPLTILR